MHSSLKTVLFVSLLVPLFGIAGCDSGDPVPGHDVRPMASGRLNGGGSTFIYPMMSRWSHEFNQVAKVQVNYQSTGSGAGIQQMMVKTFDFGCTDAPMNDEQLQQAEAAGGPVVHIPLAMGAVVPAYNLEEATMPLVFSGESLAEIYLGKIRKWNDPALQKLNPGVPLPDKEIAVVHRSDGSGTTFIWADYLAKTSAAWKQEVGVGTSLNWPTGVGQKGNEGVAGQVKRTPGSLGYVELTYALQTKLSFGSVQNREGIAVQPSLESVSAAANAAVAEIPADLRYSLTDAPGKDAYPISGTVWAVFYVNQPPEKKKAVLDFVRWMTHEGQEYTAELHYARLPQALVKRIDEKLAPMLPAP